VKLHELKPAAGSRKARTRVGRGIAAGKGKTAGRGTKGQKARSGGSIPPWFEGGQTPIHVRVPKLRGFKRRFKVEYQVINVGRIAEYAAAGRFGVEVGAVKGRSAKGEPTTVNAEVLAAAGLIRSDARPVKVLGQGELDIKLFVAADAFTASARRKIEAAGGFVQVLGAQPDEPSEADADAETEAGAEEVASAEPESSADTGADTTAAAAPDAAESAAESTAAKPATRSRRAKASPADDTSPTDAAAKADEPAADTDSGGDKPRRTRARKTEQE
jgi:large subunit ribosomal protein L15